MMLHLIHAADQDHRIAFVRTVDTNDVVLATYFFSKDEASGIVGRTWS